MKNVLITGAFGQFGLVLQDLLSNKFNLLLTSCKYPGYVQNLNASVAKLNITDVEDIKSVFDNFNPDIIINCAALTDVDAARVELIVSSNTNATHYPTFVDRIIIYLSIIQIYVFSRLSLLCKTNINIFLINISIVVFYLTTLYVWLNYARFYYQWIPYKSNFDLFL